MNDQIAFLVFFLLGNPDLGCRKMASNDLYSIMSDVLTSDNFRTQVEVQRS